jgi:site-specific DNA-methyltransferase (adenine-specific)
MSDHEIEALPVGGLAADDCALLMWTTNVKLEVAFRIIRAWGFKVTAVFMTWIKTNKGNGDICTGVGHWTRSASEIILLGTRGNISKYKIHTGLCSVLVSERREHSRKPDQVRGMILSFFGDIPRIELFSRTFTPGWDIWGNQTQTFGAAPATVATLRGDPNGEEEAAWKARQDTNAAWVADFIQGGRKRLYDEWDAIKDTPAGQGLPVQKQPAAAAAHLKRKHFSRKPRYIQQTVVPLPE